MNTIVDRISTDLHLNSEYVSEIISRSNFYYKDYYIPKVAGKKRKISQPSPELKTLQYWALKNVLIYLPVSQAAYAYKTGESIKKHAAFHADSKFIFHTDIQNFFPSIHSEVFSSILFENKNIIEYQNNWYDDICDVIPNICFRHNSLCVGTVSSPCISNIVLYQFDEWMKSFCKKRHLKYSRYADDMYISSKSYIPTEIATELVTRLEASGFKVNKDKTWYHSKKHKQRITGLIITTDEQISVGSEMRNKIKQMIYDRLVKHKGDPNVILGYLSFLKDIEPNTYNHYIIKYSTYCSGDVISAIKNPEIHNFQTDLVKSIG
ncbi:MAG TPA: retron St85 family RNA-directed DNA polymerase [Ruminiclostridium sp.]|nr:retron St85 family RNA-directed DNA polymerase [Ruminiclostridium sp.]